MIRSETKLKTGYRFRHFPEFENTEEVFSPGFDDSSWETVRVPHDWAITGEFQEQNDCSINTVEADGITRPILHSGRTGALPILGRGVYRLWLPIAEEDRGNHLTLRFDGVMWESRIYVNGQQVHFNHFGYKSFTVDITPHVEFGKPNLIAVSANVYPDCSRWYPGAGIFRNVTLIKTDPIHIEENGVWLRQLDITRCDANFLLSVSHNGGEDLTCLAEIFDPDGTSILTLRGNYGVGELSAILTIPNVKLWDVDHPQLYRANVSLLDPDGQVLDTVSLRFGARQFTFTADQGLILNGRPLKIRGVCNHHDLGSLGAAVHTAALKRQLLLMKEMGVNSIRTSHNPPSPELLDLCDEMGLIVMDEFFDEWAKPKIKNGYAKYFHQHAVEDMYDIMRRDRNHPSILLWSLGNEILEQTEPEGWRINKMLYEAARDFDPSRPITCGYSYPHEPFDNHMVNYIDVVGINYKPHLYDHYHTNHPSMKLVATETASTVSTRGVYHLPAQLRNPPKTHPDLTVSAYEMDAPPWAYFAEKELSAQVDHPYVAGEYVWTGMDYLGEPTPYYTDWPSRSSYFGAVDLAGNPKNRFYMYKAHWTRDPVLHIFPHWNWEGFEGQVVPVHVYTNLPKAELFLNGRSQGIRTLRKDSSTDLEQLRRFRMIWEDTVYEPGTLTVIGYGEDGSAHTAQIHTASAPARIALAADRSRILADGEDLVYITATITDCNGIPCPHASHRLYGSLTGSGQILTTDAGDPRETESFARPDKKALAGILTFCCRSLAGSPGSFTLQVTGEGLEEASITITTQ